MPPAVAERAFLRLLYSDHPHGHLAIGSDSSLVRRCSRMSPHSTQRLFSHRATLVVAAHCRTSNCSRLRNSIRSVGWVIWPRTDDAAECGRPGCQPHRPASRRRATRRCGAVGAPYRPAVCTPDDTGLPRPGRHERGSGRSVCEPDQSEAPREKGYTHGARTGFDWRRGIAPFALQASVHTAATADAISDSLRELESIRGSRPPTDSEMRLPVLA